MFRGIDLKDRVPAAKLIDLAVERVLEYSSRAFVFVPARSGASARSIARFRLPVWIIAVGFQEAVCRHLQFSSGVYAAYEPKCRGNGAPIAGTGYRLMAWRQISFCWHTGAAARTRSQLQYGDR